MDITSITSIKISWWWYLLLILVMIGVIVYYYLKQGIIGAIRGAIVALAIWILTPPYLVDVESLFAVMLIPVFIAFGFGAWLSIIFAYATIYLAAALILVLNFLIP